MSARTLTVAAIQTAYGPDLAVNIAKTEGFIREAARQGAQVILPSELFQGIYFCTQQDPKWFETALPGRRAPLRAGAEGAGARAARGHSDLVLRERRPALLQQRGGGRCGRRDPRCLPQEPYPRRAGLPGEILLPPGRHRLQGLEDAIWHHRRWHLLGPVVSGGGARHGAARARRCCSIPPPSARSHPTPRSIRTSSGSAPCKATRSRTLCPSWPRTASASRRMTARCSASMAIPSSPIIGGELVQSFGEADEGVLVHSFDLAEIERYRAEWGFFRDRRTDLYAKSLV